MTKGGENAGNTKSQALNPKQITKPNVQNPKRYDLEAGTFAFAKRISLFIDKPNKIFGSITTK